MPVPRLHRGPQPGGVQFGANLDQHRREVSVPAGCGGADEGPEPVVLLRLQLREDEVFQFPQVGVQAKPSGERHQQFQRRPRDPLPLLPLGVMLKGAHVVHPVGQLDHQDP